MLGLTLMKQLGSQHDTNILSGARSAQFERILHVALGLEVKGEKEYNNPLQAEQI